MELFKTVHAHLINSSDVFVIKVFTVEYNLKKFLTEE